MNNLTTLKNGVPFTDSRKVASSLGVKHAKVMEMIDRLLLDFPDLRVPPQNPETFGFNEVAVSSNKCNLIMLQVNQLAAP